MIEVADILKVPKGYVPCYTGGDVTRFQATWGNLACLDDERARRGGCWDRAKHEGKNKILTRQIGRYPEFALDSEGYHCLNTMFMINIQDENIDPYWLLGVLNSSVLRAIWLDRFYDQRRTFPKIKGTYLKKLPIPSSDLDVPARKDLIGMVKRIIGLRKQLASAHTEHEAEVLGRRIDGLEHEVDELVFRLFGLSASEIAEVDGISREATAKALAGRRRKALGPQ